MGVFVPVAFGIMTAASVAGVGLQAWGESKGQEAAKAKKKKDKKALEAASKAQERALLLSYISVAIGIITAIIFAYTAFRS